MYQHALHIVPCRCAPVPTCPRCGGARAPEPYEVRPAYPVPHTPYVRPCTPPRPWTRDPNVGKVTCNGS